MMLTPWVNSLNCLLFQLQNGIRAQIPLYRNRWHVAYVTGIRDLVDELHAARKTLAPSIVASVPAARVLALAGGAQ